MAEEKRVKLGVDLGELSNQLLQVNTLVEQNYKASIKGQQEYNKILEESISLLEKQAELVGSSSQHTPQPQLSNTTVGNSKNSQMMSEGDIRKYLILIDRIRGTMNTDDKEDNQHDNEVEDKTLDVLEKILATTENIWEKYSQEIVNPGEEENENDTNRDNESNSNNNEENTPQNDNQQQNQQKNNKYSSVQSTVLGGVNQGLSIFGKSDPNYIVTSIAAMIPYVGSGLASILQSLISEAEKQDVATARFAGSSGHSYNLGSFSDIGLNRGEAAEKAAQYYKANRNVDGYDLRFEKGYNLSSGTIDSLLRSTRQEYGRDYTYVENLQGMIAEAKKMAKLEEEYNNKNKEGDKKSINNFNYKISIDDVKYSAKEAIDIFERELDRAQQNIPRERITESGSVLGEHFLQSLSKNGNINNADVRAYSEDYLRILVDLNQRQLELTGETNSVLNSDIVTNIAKLDTHFGDPTILSRVVSSLQNGLIQANSPQIEAMQYWAMREANPNASIWQMQLMKENPFGEESRGYLSNFLEGLLRTGNKDDAKFNIQHTFGLSAHQTEYLVDGLTKGLARAKEENNKEYQDEKGNFSSQKFINNFLEKESVTSNFGEAKSKINKEAAKATSSTETTLAGMEDFMAAKGSQLLGAVSPEITKVIVGGVADGTKAILDAANSVISFFNSDESFMDLISRKFDEMTDSISESIGNGIRSKLPSWMGGTPEPNDSTPSNPQN